MRARVLAFLAASAAVLVASPSSAAPERSITLTQDRRTASWSSDLRVGPYLGDGFGCDQEALGCETSLIRLSGPGSLSITTKQRIATDAVDGRLLLGLVTSDATARAGRSVSIIRQRSAGRASITARSLAAGYYLLLVHWYDLAVGDYTGTARFAPT